MSNRIFVARRRGLLQGMLLALGLIALGSLNAAAAEKAAATKGDETKTAEAGIRAGGAAFVKAFNHGDAKAVAALWSSDGTLADERGVILKGRKAIEDEYADLFKQQPGAQIEVAIQSIEFPTPGVAVEDGTATVITKSGAAPTASRYTAIHLKQDNAWKMVSVREASIEVSSNYRRMAALEWLVGKWQTKAAGTTVEATVQWIANKSFLQRQYTVRQDGVTVSSGVQIIGIDPQSGRVRSWSFDASGGYGSGAWSATAEGWSIESSGVLTDGTPTSSQDFLIRVPNEDNVLGWRSTNRRVGNARLSDTREVVLDRVAEKR